MYVNYQQKVKKGRHRQLMKRYVLSTGEAESVRSGADGAVFYYVNSEYFFFFFLKKGTGVERGRRGSRRLRISLAVRLLAPRSRRQHKKQFNGSHCCALSFWLHVLSRVFLPLSNVEKNKIITCVCVCLFFFSPKKEKHCAHETSRFL